MERGAVGPEVVVCGPASWNQMVDLDVLPRPEPHMVFARGAHETVGGTSAGKALHLVDLGRSVLLHTVVGDDERGRLVLDALGKAGVAVDAVVADGPTERHLNLMDAHGGRVSLYLDVPPADASPPGPELTSALAGARVAVMDLSDRSRALLPAVAETGLPVWTDVHDYNGTDDYHRPFLAAASHVFMNADRQPDPVGFLHRLVDEGAMLAVCTLGASGAVAVSAGHAEHRVAAVPVAEVVDTNGAGDAFMAGVLAATLDGCDVDDALRAGARQAARALGTRHLSPLLDAAT
ncbi:carbohydrate kinase family protein [Nocardioides sp. GCM10027113]|uniref:carbohydrate kinase family protein n=1 Tax=unclassified Nocardioides TaxID=2615069 RepID=UPI00360A4D04